MKEIIELQAVKEYNLKVYKSMYERGLFTEEQYKKILEKESKSPSERMSMPTIIKMSKPINTELRWSENDQGFVWFNIDVG